MDVILLILGIVVFLILAVALVTITARRRSGPSGTGVESEWAGPVNTDGSNPVHHHAHRHDSSHHGSGDSAGSHHGGFDGGGHGGGFDGGGGHH
jgi:hypothetical protein